MSAQTYEAVGVKRRAMYSSQRFTYVKQVVENCRAQEYRSAAYTALKRTFDIAASSVIILMCAVPGMILAFFIKWSTGGAPIFRQTRIGQNGRRFRIYKLRTMVADSDNLEKYFTPEQLEAWRRERKVDNDPRITRLGGVLRVTSLDELPNFINVFLGQMSIVGPRAVTIDELDWYGTQANELLSVPPGITGWWQVTERNDAIYENGARQDLELEYVKRRSIMLDCKILLLTIGAVFKRTGK